jgi:hypothetical protein
VKSNLVTALLAAEWGYKGHEKGKSLDEVLNFIRKIWRPDGKVQGKPTESEIGEKISQQLLPEVQPNPEAKTPARPKAVEKMGRRESYPPIRVTCRIGAYPEYEMMKVPRCRKRAKYGHLFDAAKNTWYCFRCEEHRTDTRPLPDEFNVKPIRG